MPWHTQPDKGYNFDTRDRKPLKYRDNRGNTNYVGEVLTNYNRPEGKQTTIKANRSWFPVNKTKEIMEQNGINDFKGFSRGTYADDLHKNQGISYQNRYSRNRIEKTNTISKELQDHYKKLGNYYKNKYGA